MSGGIGTVVGRSYKLGLCPEHIHIFLLRARFVNYSLFTFEIVPEPGGSEFLFSVVKFGQTCQLTGGITQLFGQNFVLTVVNHDIPGIDFQCGVFHGSVAVEMELPVHNIEPHGVA